ncbi:hypothetical protein VTJ49DRAFT_7641 [Mycothermus thermophilus]|uniref:JmjC domain-containing protein n=1 Tax=Humicola insolens TaxID=85995 RepID=A0ABR3VGB7_HUMIN
MPQIGRSTRYIFTWMGKIKDTLLSTAHPRPVDMMHDSWMTDAEKFSYFTNARPDARPDNAPFLFRNLSRFSTRDDLSNLVVIPAKGFGKWFFGPRPGVHDMAGLTPRFRKHLAHTVPYELIYTPGPDGKPSPDSPLSEFIDWLRTESTDPRHRALANTLETEMFCHPHVLRHPPVSPAQDRGNDDDAIFLRFSAPLTLLDSAMYWNSKRPSPDSRLTQLYIAQVALSDLPARLQQDVPTPSVLTRPTPTPTHPSRSADPFPLSVADIYASSLWLGLTPTFTPWHRDPNPNLFCQLLGRKVVRLMPPEPGKRLFREVMTRLHQQQPQQGGVSQSAAIRGAEMMQGAERRAWEEVIWGDWAAAEGEAGSGTGSLGMGFDKKWTEGMEEAVLSPGDALYIPHGWWHSVRSVQKASEDEIGEGDGQSMSHVPGDAGQRTSLPPSEKPAVPLYKAGRATWGQEPGELNVSVNWWFRWRTMKEGQES